MNAEAEEGNPEQLDPGQLDALSTEDLRERAFARARHRHDIGFFWSIIKHLPAADDAEEVDPSLGTIGASVNDAVALFREFTGHGFGDAEPLLRAAFVDYLSTDEKTEQHKRASR